MQTTIALNKTETVADLYAAFGRGDIGYIIDHIADNCEWITPAAGLLPQGGTYIGKEAVNFFNNLVGALEFNAFEPLAILPAGEDEVVAYGRMTCTSRKTGKQMGSDWAMRWRFNADGKVVFFHDFYDTAGAYLADQN